MQEEATKTRVGEYAGPYRLLETLGKGGLATVKVGVNSTSGAKVAVKIVDKEKLINPREQVSMAREITIMKLLHHPNILRLYDIYESEDKMFLILDLYGGGDLYTHLTTNGAMRPSEALLLFRQIIEGVEFCHKNLIVHRDLKPENLLLSTDKKHLVLSDFGLSTGMQGSRNMLKTRCGTVHYISPEVANGDPYVGMASDVWSCGVILYAMVTASLPFDAPTAVGVLKKIVKGDFHMPQYLPKELQDFLLKLLTLDPKTRMTITEMKQHIWYTNFNSYKLVASKEPEVKEIINVTIEELQLHQDILQNLTLLGWEDSELRNNLLAKENNMAKVFYQLLLQHKIKYSKNTVSTKPKVPVLDLPNQSPPTTPEIKKKVSRRRSVGLPKDTLITVLTKSGKGEKRKSEKGLRVSNQPAPTQPEQKELIIGEKHPAPSEKAPSEKAPSEKGPSIIRVSHSQHQQQRTRCRSVTIGDAQRPVINPIVQPPPPLHVPLSKTPSTDNEPGAITPPAPVSPLSASDGTAVRRNRASTIGSGLRPEIVQRRDHATWSISPSQAPNSKMFKVESYKTITQLLGNLKHVFGSMQGYEVIEKKTKTGIKVQARKSVNSKKKGRAQVKIDILPSDDGKNVVSFKKPSKGDKDDFQEVVKKLEENLDV